MIQGYEVHRDHHCCCSFTFLLIIIAVILSYSDVGDERRDELLINFPFEPNLLRLIVLKQPFSEEG